MFNKRGEEGKNGNKNNNSSVKGRHTTENDENYPGSKKSKIHPHGSSLARQ